MSVEHLQLAHFGGPKAIPDPERASFTWPRITPEIEKAVLEQLHESLSIYDKSGVIDEFERSFANLHGMEFGLLSNSGTSAILAMFDAIGLMPGDEVVCPVYTFHATVSPMMSLGAKPVFADTDETGNIALSSLLAKITDNTRAVIVTHMWGVPVPDIERISKLCRERGLILLEDCSHAHGARFNGRLVGTFGDMAAWSLQGQKNITGGEGGILLTNSIELYHRALLHGHYNKRPKDEIPESSSLYDFFLTGKGLKLRAHPVATAIALEQLSHLDEFLTVRSMHAEIFDAAIDRCPFLTRPRPKDCSNAWYAYGFHFDAEKANGLSREQFVSLLHAEGLSEFDIPGSTGLLNDLPLFLRPNEVFPSLYGAPLKRQGGFPQAKAFYSTLIKLPVWAFADESSKVEAYAAGLQKVVQAIEKNTEFAKLLGDNE